MTEFETKIEAEEFTDELSDEALDRAEGALACGLAACNCWWFSPTFSKSGMDLHVKQSHGSES